MKNRIKMVVIGLRFGEYIVNAQILGDPGRGTIELVGVFDLDAAKSVKIAEQCGVRQYQSLEEVLDDATVEAIGLFTPPNGRAELIRRIIRAGKHVMTTKPFEANPAEALTVLEEARALGMVVHMNSPEPLPDQETAQIIAWQNEFNLGQPIAARWETYTASREVADGSWYDDAQLCPVAPIFRLGIYGINQLTRVFGAVNAVAVAHSQIFTGRPTADNAELSLQFKNGALGSVFASFCIDDGHRYGNQFNLHYANGSIHTEVLGCAKNYDVLKHRLCMRVVDNKNGLITRSVELSTEALPGKYQWENFQTAILDEESLPGTIQPQQIAHGLQIIQAMRQAEATGSRVEILNVPTQDIAESSV